eukprot:scaffold225331_cov19-Tisochrysis_lutea.AAC.1
MMQRRSRHSSPFICSTMDGVRACMQAAIIMQNEEFMVHQSAKAGTPAPHELVAEDDNTIIVWSIAWASYNSPRWLPLTLTRAPDSLIHSEKPESTFEAANPAPPMARMAAVGRRGRDGRVRRRGVQTTGDGLAAPLPSLSLTRQGQDPGVEGVLQTALLLCLLLSSWLLLSLLLGRCCGGRGDLGGLVELCTHKHTGKRANL